jgi:hypothetical protein
LSYERSDDRERYSDSEKNEESEYRETDEGEEAPEDKADEAVKDLEREEKAQRHADEASRELDETESESSDAKDLADEASRELDSMENEGETERSMEDDLGHDLDEVRDDLHDRFVNDMDRQLEEPSQKETETDEQDSDTGSSSDMTESSESYEDAGNGMMYALESESKGGSGEAEAQTETETEQETSEGTDESFQDVSEPEESAEETGSTADSVDDELENQFTRQEHTEAEESEEASAEGTSNQKSSETESDFSKPETSSHQEGEEQSETDSDMVNSFDTKSDYSEIVENEPEQSMKASSESDVDEADSRQTSDMEDVTEPIHDSDIEQTHENDSKETSDEVQRVVDSAESELKEYEEQAVGEKQEGEVSESDSDLEYEASDSENENIEDYARRVKEIMDEKSDFDDNYEYIQDPLTGEWQRVRKILSEYETEEQRLKRRNENLFAELSEKEREQFKKTVKEKVDDEDDLAQEVERAWSKVVERAEEISKIEKDEAAEKALDLLSAYGQQFFYFKSKEELEKRLQDACEELGIEGDDALQRLNELLKKMQAEKTMFAGNEANPVNTKVGRIKGESLRFIMELSGERTEDLEGEVSKITGVNGQGGIFEPRFPDEDRLLEILTRLYSTMVSDGHIKESGKGDYFDPEVSRIERVIENLNEIGQMKSKIVEKSKGLYRLYIPSVVSSLLVGLGFPVGDRTMQNRGLPKIILDGPPEILAAYLEEMVPEEGCFSNSTGISWNRTHGIYGPGKRGKRYQNPSLSKKQANYIKENATIDSDISKERKTLPWSELISKAESGDETAKSIVDFVNSHPNRLIKDEATVAGRLGVEVQDAPYRLRYYKKTGRVTLVSSARTKSFDDAEKWGQICPPNDIEKRKKMMDWLSKRKGVVVSSTE